MSREIEQITGYPPSEFVDNGVRTYESVIHPEDRGDVEERGRRGGGARRAVHDRLPRPARRRRDPVGARAGPRRDRRARRADAAGRRDLRHHGAQAARGRALAPRLPRRAHRPAEPRDARPSTSTSPSRGRGAPARTSRCSSSTSTTSSSSTTTSATRRATSCCAPSPSGSARRPRDRHGRPAGRRRVLLCSPTSSPPTGAAAVATRSRWPSACRSALTPPVVVAGVDVYVSASIGIATFPGDADTAGDLLKRADIAMYRAKESGRDGHAVADAAPVPLLRLSEAGRLRRALDRDEFELHYQPLVRLVDGAMLGVEALIRWPTRTAGSSGPTRSSRSPSAPARSRASPSWVVTEACRQSRTWAADGLELYVSVNLPARFWRPDGDGVRARHRRVVRDRARPAHARDHRVDRHGASRQQRGDRRRAA